MRSSTVWRRLAPMFSTVLFTKAATRATSRTAPSVNWMSTCRHDRYDRYDRHHFNDYHQYYHNYYQYYHNYHHQGNKNIGWKNSDSVLHAWSQTPRPKPRSNSTNFAIQTYPLVPSIIHPIYSLRFTCVLDYLLIITGTLQPPRYRHPVPCVESTLDCCQKCTRSETRDTGKTYWGRRTASYIAPHDG